MRPTLTLFKFLFKALPAFGIALLTSLSALAGSNQNLTYQGRIVRPDGTLPNSGIIDFTIAIYSPSPSQCLLYEETHHVTMTGSQGMFSLTMGAGTRVDGGAHNFNQVFINGATLSGLNCASGNSYAAASTDDRVLSISFNDAGNTIALSPAKIKSVPFAMQAHEVDGWGLNNLVKVSTLGSPTTFTTTEMANAKALAGAACALNEILKWNGTAWACASDATGGAPADASYLAKGIVQFDTDAATSGVTVSSGVVTVNTGTTANKIVKLDGSAKLPGVDGSALTNLDPTHLSAAVPINRGGTGQITATLGFNALSPITTKGDLITSDGTNNVRLPVGSNGYVLTADSAQTSGVKWAPVTAGTVTSVSSANSDISVVTGTSTPVLTLNSGTGADQIVKLDGSAKLPAVDGSALTNISATSYSGVLPIANGGTNSSTALNDNRVMISASGKIVEAPAMTDGQILVGSTGAAPAVATLGAANGISVTTGAGTLSIGTNATSANTASTIVSRDASGNFSAGAITNNSNVLKGATSGTITMTVPTTVTSYTLTWPSAVGGAGSFLTTDASGNLSWGSPAAIADSSYSAKGAVQFLTDAATSGITVSSGVANVNTGTGANQIVKLDGSAKLPAVDGSALTNLDPTHLSAAVPIAQGGTGQITAVLGFNALSPITTKGDLITSDGTNNVRLPAGSDGYVLTADSAQTSGVKWAPVTAGTVTSVSSANADIAVATGTSTPVLTLNSGTGNNQIVKLDGSAKLPAVDGSALTNLNAGNISSGTLPIARGGTAATSFAANAVIVSNGTGSALQALNCTSGQAITFDVSGYAVCGTVGNSGTVTSVSSANADISIATGTSTPVLTLNAGTSANQIVKLDGSAKLPAVDGSALTNIVATSYSGVLPIANGGTNSSTALNDNRVMVSSSGKIVEAAAMTDGQILVGSTGAAPVVATLGVANGISVTTGAGTLSIGTNATSANTASTIVSRDGSGNFAASAITNTSNILKGSTSGTLTMTVPTTVTSYTLTWPSGVGGAGSFLTTDASGNLSWGSPAAIADSSYAAKGAVQFLTDAATSGITVASGVANVNSGTGANQIVKLDGSAKLPAVDGSALTNLDPTHLSAAVPIAQGGTGQTTQTAGFNALSPLTTKGDLVTFDGTNNVRLPAGSDGYVLQADSTQSSGIKWAAASAGTVTSVSSANADIAVATGTSTPVLTLNSGTGADQIVKLTAASKYPAVDGSLITNLDASNIASGTLPISRGGTAATSFAANAVIVSNGTGSALQALNCTSGQVITFDVSGYAGCGAAGSVTSVTSANTDISVATGTSTPVLTLNSGTGANQIVKLDGSAKLPAVDGSALTNITATSYSGVLPIANGGTNSSTALNDNRVMVSSSGKIVEASAMTDGQILVGSTGAAPAVATLGVANGISVTTGAGTLTIGTNATAANTASTIVSRDASGNFAAGAITNSSNILKGATSGTLTMTVPTTVTSYTLTWPSAVGGAGTFLTTDASGNLSWGSPAAIADSSYAAKGAVQFLTDAATSGITVSSGVANVNSGTGANQIVKLDGSAKLPAVDGSALTNLDPTHLSAAVPINKGGTGQTTQTDGFNALSPITTKGDLITSDGTNNVRLPAGTNGYVLTADSAQSSGIKWAPVTAGTVTSVSSANADIAVATGTSTPVLTLNSGTGANQIVKLDGSAKLPAVDGSALTNVVATSYSGVLPIANGGTNSSTALNDNRVMISASGKIVEASAMTDGQILVGSTGAAPVVATLGVANGISVTTGAGTLSIGTNATSTNTASTIVSRDASGNFSAGAITNTSNILKGATSGTLTMTVPTTVTSYTLTWPSAVGGAGTFLTTDASGNLSWGSPAAIADSSYSAKGAVQFLTDAATSGITVASGVANVNSGTGANQIVKLDGSAKLPAVDGSALTNLDPTHLSAAVPINKGGTGQITAVLGFNALSPITTKGDLITSDGTNNVRLPAGSDGYVLTADSAQSSGVKWAPITAGTVTSVSSANSDISVATGTSTPVLTLNSGTGNNQIVKLDGSAKLPAVDGSALTNLNAGNISSGTLPINRGGTAATSFAANAVIVSNGTGSALQALNCTSGQVITFDVSGYAVCGAAAGATGFVNGGNSFGANASLGTNDAYSLAFKTNNSTRMTIDNAGKVGIGTTSPRTALDVSGTLATKPATSNGTSTIDGSTGNIQYTTSNCGAFQFNNLKDGASYMFVVQGTTAATCTFTAYSDAGSTALTVHMPPDNGNTTASKHTVFNLTVVGTHVYVAWTPGY